MGSSSMRKFEGALVPVCGVLGAKGYVQGLAKQGAPVLWLVAEEPQDVSVPEGVVLATYDRVRRAHQLEREGFAGAMSGYVIPEDGTVVLEHLERCTEGTREVEGLRVAMMANREATMVALDRSGTAEVNRVVSLEDGKRYPSMAAAARAIGKSPQAIKKAIKFGTYCGGRRWAKIEPGEPLPPMPGGNRR